MLKGIVGTCIGLGLAATMLSGCGGGGGSSGDTADSYRVSLRSDMLTLPLNVAGEQARIGSAYTTTLYVSAKDVNDNPIAVGNFACNIVDGLESGALYYLDGDPAHEEEIDVPDGTPGAECNDQGTECKKTVPIGYRSITLETNSGTASFHFHADNVVGSVTIRCSIVDAGGTNQSMDISLQVGGQSTGKVSQVIFDQMSPNFLFVQGLNGETQVQAQVNLVDEAGQKIADPEAGVNNVQVRIVPDSTSLAENDAILMATNASGQLVSGTSVHIRSIQGQAQFTLISGTHPGTILLEAISDRTDNNVSNGVTQQVYNYAAVDVVTENPSEVTPIVITTESLPAATLSIPYGALIEASGGTLPYTWSLASSGLPSGLSLSSSGVISGTPSAAESGTYSFVVKVTDANGTVASKQLSISYTAPEPEPSVPVVTTPSLANGTVSVAYLQVLAASGGDGTYAWTAAGLPAGLTMTAATGVISGTPTTAGAYPVAVTVTSAGKQSTTPFTLTVNP